VWHVRFTPKSGHVQWTSPCLFYTLKRQERRAGGGYGSQRPTMSSVDHRELHEKIALIETDIEGLTEALDRCRKAMLLAKVAIAAGALWILAVLVGVSRLDTTPNRLPTNPSAILRSGSACSDGNL